MSSHHFAFALYRARTSQAEQRIELSGRQLGARDLKYLQAYLNEELLLDTLALNHCTLGDEAMVHLKDLNIRHLEIANNHIGAYGSNSLCQNRYLLSIKLSNNHISATSLDNMYRSLLLNRQAYGLNASNPERVLGSNYAQQITSDRAYGQYIERTVTHDPTLQRLKRQHKKYATLMISSACITLFIALALPSQPSFIAAIVLMISAILSIGYYIDRIRVERLELIKRLHTAQTEVIPTALMSRGATLRRDHIEFDVAQVQVSRQGQGPGPFRVLSQAPAQTSLAEAARSIPNIERSADRHPRPSL